MSRPAPHCSSGICRSGLNGRGRIRFWNGAQPIDQYVFRYKDDWYMVYGGWHKCNLVRLSSDFRSLVPFEDGRLWRPFTPEGYAEGSVMFERKGIWYFMYSFGSWEDDTYGVRYSTSDSPFGPFTYRGCVLSSQRPLATGAGHHSVLCIPGTDDWYVCYHRRPVPNTSPHHRVTCLDRLFFNDDGTIRPVVMSAEGDGLSVVTNPVGRCAKEKWCAERFDLHLREIKGADGTFDLVFIGDSITHNWENCGHGTLERLRRTYSVLNLGYHNCCDGEYVYARWPRVFRDHGFQCVTLIYRTPRAKGIPYYQTAWEDGQWAEPQLPGPKRRSDARFPTSDGQQFTIAPFVQYGRVLAFLIK